MPNAINDEIANACADLFAVHMVEISATTIYNETTNPPTPGHAILSARVEVEPRLGDQFQDEAVDPVETQHPTIAGQRIKWQHSDTTTEGVLWVLTFVGLHA